MYRETKIADYLNALASKAPAPGGGSVAALTGAMACAMLAKVLNFTVGKERYKDVEMEMADILKRAGKLGDECNKLCSDDAVAYRKLSEAFKLPKESGREERLQNAYKEAMEVPLKVCRNAHEGIKLCPAVVKKGNTNLITDTGIASLLFECAFRSAALNVDVNLKGIKDESFVRGIRDTIDKMQKEVVEINQKVEDRVESYLK